MNDTVQVISAAISSVGFPAIFCVLLLKRTDEQSRTISAFTRSIDRLTAALNRVFRELEKNKKESEKK